MTTASLDIDARRRRIRFRAWHRGTQEMDLILGRFADARIAGFDEAGLAAFEALMEIPDPDLFNWITGLESIPAGEHAPLLRELADFHNR